MKILKEIKTIKNFYVTYGTFDGVHNGHRETIKTLVENAKKNNEKSLVISFYKTNKEHLSTEKEKIFLIKELGVDYFCSVEENENIKQLLKKEEVKCIVSSNEQDFIDEIEKIIEIGRAHV